MRAFSRLAALGVFIMGSFAAAAVMSPAEASRRTVRFQADYAPGTIVIVQHQRKLYLTLGDGRAISYRVAVGKSGKGWTGWTRVEGKYVRPAWSPPASVKAWNPRIPDLIPGGAPNNPMGERALTLTKSEIAIHGTTRSMRKSIGRAASFGCIRMYNEDVVDLYNRVSVGTPVVALP